MVTLRTKIVVFSVTAVVFILYLTSGSNEPYKPAIDEESHPPTRPPHVKPPSDKPPTDKPEKPKPEKPKPEIPSPPTKLPDRPEDLIEPKFVYPVDQDPTQSYAASFGPTPKGQNIPALVCPSNCHDKGWCFMGKCYCYPGFKGRYCNIHWDKKPPLCDIKSDSCFVTKDGVAMVSKQRWEHAQKAEQSLWSGNPNTDDRAQEHVDGYKGYKVVPDRLGHILEVGCGPWTQSKFMLQTRTTFTVESVTLWEPGLLFYVSNTPTCSYKDGKFMDYSTILVNAGAEQLLLHEEYDTVSLINVLEHVVNAYQIMENVYNALKPGGIFIFNDRWWDNYDFYGQLVGGEHGILGLDRQYHPIHLKKEIFEHFMSFFDVLLDNRDAAAFTTRGLQGTYFIGRKKALQNE